MAPDAAPPDPKDLERLRAEHFGGEVQGVRVEFGAKSHPGKVRSNNEDHFMVVRRFRDREILLTNLSPGTVTRGAQEAYAITVADGMGGASFGEIASMLALRSALDLTSRAFRWHFNLSSEDEMAEVQSLVRLYGRLIHEEIQKNARELPERKGMGTTIACMISVGFEGVVAHAGDSRVYLHRGGTLHALTRDHTVAAALAAGETFDEGSDVSLRNILLNCLGGDHPEVKIDTSRFRIQTGDVVLVCTDGLTEMVPEPDIARVLGEGRACQKTANELVALALQNGGRDNVTAVVARYLAEPK